jgi:MFS family permease
MYILTIFNNIIRRYPPGIWITMIIQAIRSMGFSISFTYLPLYLYQQRGISMTVVGLFFLVAGITAGVSQIGGGALADRFGHRRLFVIFMVAEIVAFALLAVLIGTNSPIWSIFITTSLVMIAGNMSAPAISAIVADVSQDSTMTESYGLMAIGGNLGWAIGPLTGGYLQSLTSYAWVFGVGALITAFSLIGLPYLPREAAQPAKEFRKAKTGIFLSDLNLIVFCGICMLFFLEMAQWGSTLSVFTVDRVGFASEQYGLLMSISGLLIILFQFPISKQIERLGFRRSLFLGSILYGAGFLSFAWVKSFLPAVGSIVILVAGEMLFIPASYAVIGKISRLEDRAKSMGMLGLCGTIGNSFGPLFGGMLLDRFPAQPLLLWGPVSVPAFLAAVSFLLWRGYARTRVKGNSSENI